ncbi:gp30 [Burkholderia pseudomallei]|nr:gp30 [Burkholderia pseudomallei]CAJ6833915.1 gp30 [Burkholderia pseudomallei]CAJ9991220.1 gp30 [Burkholderia pseudomallei]
MTEDEIKAWIADPRRADTLPFGVYEPAYQKGITGAALVVRGVVYFRDGHTPAVRAAIVQCFEQYRATIDEYTHALQVAAGEKPSKEGPLRWFYTEGEQPMTLDKAPGLAALAETIPADEALVVQLTSAKHKLATGFYEFAVFTIADWQANLGRGMDVIDFTVPRAFLEQRPGVFQALFAAFCEALPTVSGHAGFAVNVPPMGREPNEASEYFFARRYGPGIDVGDPMGVSTVDLVGKIKTVDWLVALDADLVGAAGGADSLTLPPDWYVRQPLKDGGLIVQAGAAPQSGVSAGPGKPPLPPPAYVLLDAALRPIIAESMDILQSGTLDSTAPMLNTTIATEAWLKRFVLPDDQIMSQWQALHASPKVAESKPAIAANLHRLRKAMRLPDVPAASNGFGYDSVSGA